VTALLDQVLRPGALSVRFQGVYEIGAGQARCHYAEALTRGPRGSSLESPDVLFEYARKRNREAPVDRACVDAILSAARELPGDLPLGLNVHASTLALDPDFTSFLAQKAADNGISMARLVVEIVEHAPPWDLGGFHHALDHLRHDGARIALDDVGLGHSNYMMILECRPDYFKIDRYFVHGAQDDYYRQAVLTSVSQLARPFKARVIAEGVETDEDLAMAKATGIELAQGFLFGPFDSTAAAGTMLTQGVPDLITGPIQED
jgi:EAL domain-containing protein (putative c-di-GMP-specific phosphodiesterase class I)